MTAPRGTGLRAFHPSGVFDALAADDDLMTLDRAEAEDLAAEPANAVYRQLIADTRH
jgi:hypothetical protein